MAISLVILHEQNEAKIHFMLKGPHFSSVKSTFMLASWAAFSHSFFFFFAK